MSGRWLAGAASLTVLLASCGRPNAAPVPAANEGVAVDSSAEAPPPPRAGLGMPMRGRMAGMHARMMGGGSPGVAPEATAVSASAPGCPDITQELTDRGREVYAGRGNCFACHGGDLTGSQLAPDLTDDEWLIASGSYRSLVEVVRSGVAQPRQFQAPMPPLGGGDLSQEQVCAVAAYVYSLGR